MPGAEKGYTAYMPPVPCMPARAASSHLPDPYVLQEDTCEPWTASGNVSSARCNSYGACLRRHQHCRLHRSLFGIELLRHAGAATLRHRWHKPVLSVSGRESPRCTPARIEHQPPEAAMGWLRLLTGLRDASRGARSSGGMLIVMMALAGLLTQKPVKRADSTPSQQRVLRH